MHFTMKELQVAVITTTKIGLHRIEGTGAPLYIVILQQYVSNVNTVEIITQTSSLLLAQKVYAEKMLEIIQSVSK